MPSSRSLLFSLQSKLIAAFVLLVLAALVLAGGIFVFSQRGEQEQQALDHVIATSPAIYSPFAILQERGASEADLIAFAGAAAEEFDVRILLIDRMGGAVVADSEGDLTGERLALPSEVSVEGPRRFQSHIFLRPEKGTPGSDLIVVSSAVGRFPGIPQLQNLRNDRLALFLAVPESTVTRAWLGLLPELSIAAAIALPAAVALGVLVAGYISGPLRQLTAASQRMAKGRYDVEVSVDRQDEVGRLAQAFSTMARRVGEAHTQMRGLVANVSHDLKTPLTSILGFAQALRDGGATDEAEARRMGAVIHDEASRLSARLNDLLLLSELESGQALVQQEDIDLRRLVEGAVRRIEPDLAARDVALSVDLAEGVVVSADGAKLERALENLLDNARKFTPAAGAISVRSRADESAPGRARIEVANAAPDMSPEELPRLFERFYRRDRTRAQGESGGGSGLGLAIARDLVELQGGALDAALRDGEVVFTIRLPLPAESSPPAAS